ncbi:aldo/keto reductase [Candidatus Poribacteria bacterium]|nr:aldo/keto reductase [Candidatus Poribacteria bacterium]
MKYRTFPKTDITVSEVGFGVWTLSAGWWGDYTDAEAVSFLRRAHDLGITYFDTADTYGNGRGETLVAGAFRDCRGEVVIGTKFGYDFYGYGDGPRGQRELPQNWHPDYMRYACEHSLKRLETDVIDLYQVHNLKMDSVLNDDIYSTLDDLVAEGKIRAYGGALGPSNGWLVEGKAAMRRRNLTSMQLINNLFEQYPGRELTETGAETQTGILVRVTHSSGLLEGRYTRDTVFPKGDHRRHRPRYWLENGLRKLETVGFLTEGRAATIGQMALKFLLAQPIVMTTLPNIYTPEQLDEFAAAPECDDLTPEELGSLDALYADNFGVEEPVMDFKGVSEDSPEAQVLLGEASGAGT